MDNGIYKSKSAPHFFVLKHCMKIQLKIQGRINTDIINTDQVNA